MVASRRPYSPLPQDEGEHTPLHADLDRPITPANPPLRPAIYYNDGPFSPPSSLDDDGEPEKYHGFLHDDDSVEDNDEGNLELGQPAHKQRPAALRNLVLSLIGLVTMAAFIGILAARSYNGTAFRTHGRKQLALDHVFNGTFGVDRKSLNWVPEAGDGVFSVRSALGIDLVDLKSGTNRTLVSLADVKDEHGRPLDWSVWSLSPDMKYILLKTDVIKQWRHSSFGNYYIHDLNSHTTTPIAPPTNPAKIAYATWSPTGNSIAYVSGNDLYVVPDATKFDATIRVTSQGNSSLFFGVPDWVYEEEVFSADFALWWSPDSERIAFLRLDETAVDEYQFPVYNPSRDSYGVHPYTGTVTMKYPKPGYANPLVTVHIFSLPSYKAHISTSASQHGQSKPVNRTLAAENSTLTLTWDAKIPAENSVIFDVTWVANETLLVKEATRASDDGNVVIFDLGRLGGLKGKEGKGRVIRRMGEKGEQGDKGWIDSAQSIFPLVNTISTASVGHTAYLDILPTKEGFNHIALFSPADSSVPRWLTSGDWEVTGNILNVDHVKGLVYFMAASSSGIERHLYSVPLPNVSGPPPSAAPKPTVAPTALTDVGQPSYYSASFSPQTGYYQLSYDGPLVPWQRVVNIGNSSFNYVLTNNEALNKTHDEFQAPIISYGTIDSDGYEINVMELRPPGMDDSGRVKYPVLFKVYGGPASQEVNTRFKRDWHDYLVCTLKYIVVVVDGRGTGFKGRALRNPVRGTLGTNEVLDQINAARLWATKRYVDPHRIGIWGWSYGGFMTSKVLEADAGIHTLGMAVAPVVAWRLYDSVYTERYMRTPQENPQGYLNASITNVTGFNHADFLLAHGSGDDNVHFANSAHLLDMFTAAKVRDFRFRMFTDSDHSISTRGANRELYEWMTAYLIEKWGKGGSRRT